MVGDVAQLGERQNRTLEVVGSSPIVSTIPTPGAPASVLPQVGEGVRQTVSGVLPARYPVSSPWVNARPVGRRFLSGCRPAPDLKPVSER